MRFFKHLLPSCQLALRRSFCSTAPFPVFTSSKCIEHHVPGHPESPERLTTIFKSIETAFESDKVKIVDSPIEAPKDTLRLVHTDAYIDDIFKCGAMAVKNNGLVHLDADTAMCPQSLSAALSAANCMTSAVDSVMGNGPFGHSAHKRALAAVRPPGHHSGADYAMGFCLFNNVCIAATYALSHYSSIVRKCAVVDFDVHHSNGTQDIILGRHSDDLMLISMHQHPFYPGTGEPIADKRIVNIPLFAGSGTHQIKDAFENTVIPQLNAFKPDLLLISAGFDAHIDDPLAQLCFVNDDYRFMTEELVRFADDCCDGRVVSTLEGGYNLLVLDECINAHISKLL